MKYLYNVTSFKLVCICGTTLAVNREVFRIWIAETFRRAFVYLHINLPCIDDFYILNFKGNFTAINAPKNLNSTSKTKYCEEFVLNYEKATNETLSINCNTCTPD